MSVLLILAVLMVRCSRSSPAAPSTPPPVPPDSIGQGHDWTRFGWDMARSSTSTAPTGITSATVGSMHRQQVTLDGTVDASAIYLSDVQVGGAAHDVFFVTTAYGKTIAIDANAGTIIWTYTPAGYGGWVGSAQITTATPVADPDRQHIYATSPDGRVQKLSVADGSVVWSTAVTLSPDREKLASPLNYFGGRVVAVTGGYVGDAPAYQGHVALIDASSGRLTHVWYSLCSTQVTLVPATQCGASGSAIWGRAGAVVDSVTGNIYVATGNGLWDGGQAWGDAVIILDSTATRMLGNYTPANTQNLAEADLDLGSSSPVLLGGGWIAQGGKDGVWRLLNMGSIGGATPHKGGEAQTLSTPGGQELLTAAVVSPANGGTLMVAADDGGTGAWTLSGGHLSPVWHNGNAGTSPVIAGGLLYVYDPSGGGLRVYQPATGSVVATLPCGGGHWNSPIVADGRIALPEGSANDHTTNGVLDIWR